MIPWASILKHAPALIAAADALRARVTANDAGDRTRGIDVRLGELEGESRAAAQLALDMAQQINTLTLAQQSTARRARIALGLAIAAVVLGSVGVILAIVA
jgi:hypothetical protein